MKEMKQGMKAIASQYESVVTNLNDKLADNPEISGKEFESTKKVVEVLKNNGIKTVECPFFGLETSFKATINDGKRRKAAILVEYDALPDIGHGCGHCASAAISVLAGLILNELKDKVDAQIDIIGTPDEEFSGCKAEMADAGVFDEYDFAIMIHIHNNLNCVYQKLLALDATIFQFKGEAAHAAAAPWEGKNALNASRLFFDAVDMMRQHVTPDVRLHGYIVNGGEASNVVPDYTSIEFLSRANDRLYLNDVTAWIKECAKAAAMATRTELSIEKASASFADIASYHTAEAVLTDIFEDLGLPLTDCSEEGIASSDVGNVDYVCPTFQPFIGVNVPHALHTRGLAQAMKSPDTHKSIINGGLVIAQFIYDVYHDEKILEKIKEEYRLRRGSDD